MKTFLTFILSAGTFFLSFSQSIQTTVTGSGDPILFLAGFASTSDVWVNTQVQFKDTHEIHLVDYAGFGVLPAVKTPFLKTVKEDLKTYIQNIDNENLVVIGHSMGGTLAAWLAAQPDLKMKQIVIIDGLAATGALMFPDTQLSTLQYDSPYNNQMLEMDALTFAQTAGYMSTGMATAPQHQEIIKQNILNTDRKTYVYGYTDYLKFDIRKDLDKITVPVTILGAAGMFGIETATATFNSQYKLLKDFSLFMHPTSKHFIMYDDSKWLNKQLWNSINTDAVGK